jgi:RNA polymerase sigma factor (sigma-70 family)
LKEYSDIEIIEDLCNRKGEVVHYLTDRYLPMVRLMVYRMGGTAEDAKDIFQDALIILLYKIDKNELVLTCRFKTFLYSVCLNLWKSVLDKRSAAANYLIRHTENEIAADFSEAYDMKLYENIFYDMYETLDPVCQKILKFYWEDYSPREIALKLGYSYGYVRKKKCECQGELVSKVRNNKTFISLQRSEDRVGKVVYENNLKKV